MKMETLILNIAVLGSLLTVSGLNSLSYFQVACPNSPPVKVACIPHSHVAMESITLTKKEHGCSATLHNTAAPSSIRAPCCKRNITDTELVTFRLPSNSKNVNAHFALAIRSCSFERNTCIIPTKPDVFLPSSLTTGTVDVVVYKYRCLPASLMTSICDASFHTSTTVTVYHDGAASGRTEGCQCHITTSGSSDHITVKVIYMKNTECSFRFQDGSCDRLFKCDDPEVLSGGEIMTSASNNLTMGFNATANNNIAVEIKSTTGTPVSVACGSKQTVSVNLCSSAVLPIAPSSATGTALQSTTAHTVKTPSKTPSSTAALGAISATKLTNWKQTTVVFAERGTDVTVPVVAGCVASIFVVGVVVTLIIVFLLYKRPVRVHAENGVHSLTSA